MMFNFKCPRITREQLINVNSKPDNEIIISWELLDAFLEKQSIETYRESCELRKYSQHKKFVAVRYLHKVIKNI